MRDRFLEPRQNLGHGADVLFRQEAVHPIAQAHVDPAVPQSADLHVDLAVVDFLKLCG
jgi:hypothetical protein